MRFVWLVILGCFGTWITCLAAYGADQLQRRQAGFSETPQVPEHLQVNRFSSGFGLISAMTLMDDGSVLVCDQKQGRAYHLTDRDKDGRLDQTRILIDGLKNPSGLTISGREVFVADERAIWRVNLSGSEPEIVASLIRVQALAYPRPLIMDAEGSFLFLGLNDNSNHGRIIGINVQTGQASLLWQGAYPALSFMLGPNSELWVNSGDRIWPFSPLGKEIEAGLEFETSNNISSFIIPGASADFSDVFRPWMHHIFLALGGDHPDPLSRTVVAVPTRMGQPIMTQSEILVSGFISDYGRSAWGYPGAMALDERGLFLADRWGGQIWLIGRAEPKKTLNPDQSDMIDQAEPDVRADVSPDTGSEITPQEKPLLPKGSGIEAGSQIEFGSGLVRDWKKQIEIDKSSDQESSDLETKKDAPSE